MSNVIAFLDSLGRSAAPTPTASELADAVSALPVDDDAKAALLAGDTGRLSDLLGGRPKMICMLFPADDDQKKDGDEEPTDPAPDDDRKESVRH